MGVTVLFVLLLTHGICAVTFKNETAGERNILRSRGIEQVAGTRNDALRAVSAPPRGAANSRPLGREYEAVRKRSWSQPQYQVGKLSILSRPARSVDLTPFVSATGPDLFTPSWTTRHRTMNLPMLSTRLGILDAL